MRSTARSPPPAARSPFSPMEAGQSRCTQGRQRHMAFAPHDSPSQDSTVPRVRSMERLAWQPSGASSSFTLDVTGYFAEVFGET